jgi:hypothetical protein
MALRPCKECKKEISSDAKVCPHCGKKQDTGAGCGCLSMIAFVAVILIIGSMISNNSRNGSGSGSSNGTAKSAVDPKQQALSQAKLNYHWRKEGFGNVMIADFVVKNDSAYSFKDFEIKCLHYAKSGTLIDSNTQTIYDVIKSNSTKSFPETNMGFIHSQAARSSCEITDLTVVQ